MGRWYAPGLITALFCGVAGGCESQTGPSSSGVFTVNARVVIERRTSSVTEPLLVRYILENTGNESFTFLPWGTPLEEPLTADCFDVFYNGSKLPYRGIMVKRAAPVDSDYTELLNGEVIENTIDLTRAYNMHSPGTYTVQLKTSDGIYYIGSQALNVVSAPVDITRTER